MRLPVLLLFALPLLAHAAAGSSDVWFNDWLQGNKEQGVTARTASGDGAEWKSVCLKDTSYNECACASTYFDYTGDDFLCFDDFAVRSTVGCCDSGRGDDQLGGGFLASNVGDCEWRVDRNVYPRYLPTSNPNVEKYGTFSVQCKLNANSDSCGHPLCESMVLTGYGALYIVYDSYIDSLPNLPPIDEYCDGLYLYSFPRLGANSTSLAHRRVPDPPGIRSPGPEFFQKLQRSAHRAAKRGKQAPVKTSAYGHDPERSYHGGDHDGPRMAYPTDYVMWAGTFYVTNAGKSTKFSEGFLEYIWDYNTRADPVPVPSGAYVGTPFAIKLKFVESGDEY